MNSISHIKFYILFICFLLSVNQLQSQNNETQSDEEQNENAIVDTKQKSMIFSFGLYQPMPTEDSFIGKGSRGKISFDLGFQIFVYKHFFVGAFTGTKYLDINNPEFTGNYKKSTVTNSYLQVGYEFQISNSLRLGAAISPYGTARYKNIIENDAEQIDHAKFSMYGAYLSYKVGDVFYLYAGYSYRNDRTEIITALEIQNQFDNVSYHNISFGIKFYVGNKDVISSL